MQVKGNAAAAAALPAVLEEIPGAELPHPHSSHVPVYLYETTIDVVGHSIKLVLPESEDVVVNMYSALGRPDDDPHWATLWQGSVALAEEVLTHPELVRGKRHGLTLSPPFSST